MAVTIKELVKTRGLLIEERVVADVYTNIVDMENLTINDLVEHNYEVGDEPDIQYRMSTRSIWAQYWNYRKQYTMQDFADLLDNAKDIDEVLEDIKSETK